MPSTLSVIDGFRRDLCVLVQHDDAYAHIQGTRYRRSEQIPDEADLALTVDA
jgi:hypothetical protein